MKAIKTTLPLLPVMTVLERAVLYARVSGDDRGKEGRNLSGQLEMGQKYAAEKGYQVVAECSEDDRGASGYEIDLPELNKIRDMARQGEFDVLIVRELDRLSRNLAKQLIVEEELRRAGIRVEYVLGEYEDTPEGRLNKHIRATIAEYEREKIKERLVRGRRQSVRTGNVSVSDRPPYGYKVAKHNGKTTFEIVEEEARIVRLIFEWYIEGNETSQRPSLASIAKKLSEMRVPTRGDTNRRVSKKRGYGQWNRKTIHRILRRETYTGTWHYGKSGNKEDLITVEVPAIIPREVWEAAQPRLEENKKKSRRNLKNEYLLSKQITCGGCGYKMVGTYRLIKGKKYFYYRCPSKDDLDMVRDCNLPYFSAQEVESAVWDWVKSVLTDPERLSEGLDDYQAQQTEEYAPLQERLKIIDDLLTDNQAQLQRLLDLYLSGDFPKEMLTERKGRLEGTIRNLESERIRLAAHLEAKMLTEEQVQTVKDFADKVREGLAAADDSFKDRRRIIEMLDVQVRLAIENDEKVAYVQCRLGEERLMIMSLASYEKFW